MLLYLVLFVGVFGALYNVVIAGDGLSVLDSSVDAIRSKIIDYLERGDNKRKMDILGTGPEKYIRSGFAIGVVIGFFAFAVTIPFLKALSLSFIIAGAIFGVFLSDLLLRSSYIKWQEGIQDGVPVLVDFLPAFLEVKGVTIRDALENTVSFLPDPLKAEMSDAVSEIKRNGNAPEVFDRLKTRANNPMMGAICSRLAMSWETTVTSEMFLDLREEIEQTREQSAVRATNAMKLKMIGIVMVALIGLGFLAGYPGAIWLIHTVSNTFGS